MSRNAVQEDPTSSGLLRRVAAGDQQAWDQLVSHYGPLVYAFARKRGVSPTDAIDVVQEVFLGYATRSTSFEHVSFRGWLRVCVAHKSADHFRRLAKQPVAAGGSTFLRFLTQHPEPEQAELELDDLVDAPGAGDGRFPPTRTGAAEKSRSFPSQPSGAGLNGVSDSLGCLPLSKEIAAVVEQVRRKTSARCWQVFWRVVMEEHDTQDVALDTGMKLGALHECISRTRRRLRRSLAALDPSLATETEDPAEDAAESDPLDDEETSSR